MHVNGKMRPVEINQEGVIKENDGEVNSSIIYYLCKCHMYPHSAQQ
jgi:hypothetical protein